MEIISKTVAETSQVLLIVIQNQSSRWLILCRFEVLKRSFWSTFSDDFQCILKCLYCLYLNSKNLPSGMNKANSSNEKSETPVSGSTTR